MSRHDGSKFSAYDMDQDGWASDSCSTKFKSGWWFEACHSASLNGQYLRGPHFQHGYGVEWDSWRGAYYPLKTTKMMLRCH